MSARLAVVGAGISGLAAAHRLGELARERQVPLDLTVIEASGRVGGVVRTHIDGDLLVEEGPDAFITQKPAALALCRRLGLESRLVSTSEAHRRTFVAFRGKLHPLPDGFVMLAPTDWGSFLKSSLFSPFGKLRMAIEPFLPAAGQAVDESLAQFVRRRLGREALERVAQPMIGGIYTADPERLSLQATMPRFLEMERKYGSIIKGLLAQKSKAGASAGPESGARYSMFMSLTGGLTSLVDALSASLPPGCLRLGTVVSSVVPAGAGWLIKMADGGTLACDGVVVALPADRTAAVLREGAPAVSALVGEIELASSVVVNLVFDRQAVRDPLAGFGFVVPRIENRSIIACSYASVKFPGRAPAGKVVLRVFMGGALQPEIAGWDDEELVDAACRDAGLYLGISGKPLQTFLSRYNRSMPQFHVGHLARIESLEQQLRDIRGLAVAGNAYRGVGMPDCIDSGERAAERVFNSVSA